MTTLIPTITPSSESKRKSEDSLMSGAKRPKLLPEDAGGYHFKEIHAFLEEMEEDATKSHLNLTQVQSENIALRSELSALQQQTDAANSKLTEQSRDIESQQQENSELKSIISSLENKVESLQSSLDEENKFNDEMFSLWETKKRK